MYYSQLDEVSDLSREPRARERYEEHLRNGNVKTQNFWPQEYLIRIPFKLS